VTATRDGRDAATITLRDGALTIVQHLTETALDLRLTQGEDDVRLVADLSGRVVVSGGGQHRAFLVRSATEDDVRVVRGIVERSAALAAFDRLLQSPWAATNAAVAFRSTRALIRVLEGDDNAIVEAPAPRVAPRTAIVLARQRLSPSQCWDTYSRDVVKFTYDLQSCLSQTSANWWNPLHVAWCSYEYNLKSSLASIWLLDCYGVPV
jgi:hypothetical protein